MRQAAMLERRLGPAGAGVRRRAPCLAWRGDRTGLPDRLPHREEPVRRQRIRVCRHLRHVLAIPARHQHRVLMYGIIGALIMRGAFIAGGAALLDAFHATVYLFGALLIYAAVKLFRHTEGQIDPSRSLPLRLLSRVIPTARQLHGQKLLVRLDGRRLATPLLTALLLIETADVIFAADSIPAVFGSHPRHHSWSSRRTSSRCWACGPCTSSSPEQQLGCVTCRRDWASYWPASGPRCCSAICTRSHLGVADLHRRRAAGDHCALPGTRTAGRARPHRTADEDQRRARAAILRSERRCTSGRGPRRSGCWSVSLQAEHQGNDALEIAAERVALELRIAEGLRAPGDRGNAGVSMGVSRAERDQQVAAAGQGDRLA